MNIEVGEYIRTKQGTIGQIIEKYKKYCVIANRRGEIDVPYENILTHSKDISDLIETGDFVNGQKVISSSLNCIWTVEDVFNKSYIKSIVTEEQFSNMEYIL